MWLWLTNFLVQRETLVDSVRLVVKTQEYPGAKLMIDARNGNIICYICNNCNKFNSKNTLFCKKCSHPFVDNPDSCKYYEWLIEITPSKIMGVNK